MYHMIFHPTWRVFVDGLTFGDEEGLREEKQGQRGKKSAQFTAKTSKPLGNQKFRRENKNRKQENAEENAEENSHRDHLLDIKSCQIRWAKQEPTETRRIRQK